jgi:hypothetical protein
VSRTFKWLILLAFAGVLAGTGSYAGARFGEGKLLGPNPPVTGRSTHFVMGGTEAVKARPGLWVFEYSRVQLPGVARAKVFVSVTGRVLRTEPRDLTRRLEAYDRARRP